MTPGHVAGCRVGMLPPPTLTHRTPAALRATPRTAPPCRLNVERKEVIRAAGSGHVHGGERADAWTVLEVEEWLKRVKCAEYVGVFREHCMDGVALAGLHRLSCDMQLLHKTLRTEFGMTVMGQRLRMVEELYKLFN